MCPERRAKASFRVPATELAYKGFSGAEVGRRIVETWRFAFDDPYRAVTHNKGIMNGIDAGNYTRNRTTASVPGISLRDRSCDCSCGCDRPGLASDRSGRARLLDSRPGDGRLRPTVGVLVACASKYTSDPHHNLSPRMSLRDGLCSRRAELRTRVGSRACWRCQLLAGQ